MSTFWTQERQRALESMASYGEEVSEIARTLGVTVPAVYQQASRTSVRLITPTERRALEETQAYHARLLAAHGPDRARDIIAGNDVRTNADLAAWARLCQVAR